MINCGGWEFQYPGDDLRRWCSSIASAAFTSAANVLIQGGGGTLDLVVTKSEQFLDLFTE